MEKEIRELKKGQDLAHSRIEELLRVVKNNVGSQKLMGIQSVDAEFERTGMSDPILSESSEGHSLSDAVSDSSKGIDESMIGIGEYSDDMCKEVGCIKMA